MNRPVVIVDPLSSGVELAPAFNARGIPVIAVTFKYLDRIGFGTKVQTSDFIEVIPDQPGLEDILRKFNPRAIIPGTESGVELAERLASVLTPEYANDPEKSIHRLHKAHMQQALQDAGVPVIKTLHTASIEDTEAWIEEHGLTNSPLIIKPPISAGSDKVFHIPKNGDWRKAFNCVLTEPSKIFGKASETVVVQEEAIGTEFALGTVSANGKHYLSHLIKYNKPSYNNRRTVYDHVEFVPYDNDAYRGLFEYAEMALDALGIRWGASHTEIILTENGPRLIETGARMCGGPVVGFSREATGCSQADRIVEIFADGDVVSKEYTFKKTVMPVFLKSPLSGALSNVEALNEIDHLPTLFQKHVFLKDGDHVPQTVDYLTSIGIVALSGNRDAIYLDYEKIREMESKLIIQQKLETAAPQTL